MRRLTIGMVALILAAGVVWAQDPQGLPNPQEAQASKDAKYTNESVARLSFVEGKTFVQRASDLGYEEGALNMPISEGDRIGTTDGRAEIHFGRGNYIRLDNETKLDVLNLPKKDDDVARLRVWSGNVYLVVGSLKKEKAIELHTADSSFYVLERGIYRINVRESKDTEIEVFEGLIEAAGEEGSTLLKSSQRLEISEGRFASKPKSFIAVANDGFDKFNESRNAKTVARAAKGRLPEELADYEDELNEYGRWVYVPPYGDVWVPYTVEEGWRPYWYGRWTWLPLTGWTWWPYEPWGWATFHYGRWHWAIDIGWYWIPMSVWGPAWVSWWWDDFYFGWAPLSYWGYPAVIIDGRFYGHYYGPYYPYSSAALTVVRRDHLKDPGLSRLALRGDELKGLTKMSLTQRTLTLRPAGSSKISVQPLDGNRVLLRKDDRASGLERDARRVGSQAAGGLTQAAPRVIRKPAPSDKASGASAKPTTKGETVRTKGQADKPATGTAKASGSAERRIRKRDENPETGPASAAPQTRSSSLSGRTPYGYPSSPSIRRPAGSSSSASGRTRTLTGPVSSRGSSRPSSIRSSGSSAGRIGTSRSGSARLSSSSGRSSSGRVSSGASRGSASVSRGVSGGSVRRK